VTSTASFADTVDWEALCHAAKKIAARYVPPQDVDDIAQDALIELVKKNNSGSYDPTRASRQTYLMVSLRYAVLGAVSAYVYGSYDLGYEECREAFRRWDGADPADIVATLIARYVAKGYSKATATEKAQKIAVAIGGLPPEKTMPPEWWAQHGVAP
jgi:DNA-directed RNA polymerase specialized sigma24 family protein